MIRCNLTDKDEFGLLGWLQVMAKERGLNLGPLIRSLLATHPEIKQRIQEGIPKWKV